MRRFHHLTPAFAVALSVVGAGPLLAWNSNGHRAMSRAALEMLDESVIRLGRRAREDLVAASAQPDVERPRELPQLREREAPEHYVHLEPLQGRPLPTTRSEYLRLVARLAGSPNSGIGPGWTLETVGALPYAIVEHTQRLAVTFAQLRRGGHDPWLTSMAMMHAGFLAHYAQDLCQPLHTTVHHNGRARRDGSSPTSGIHHLMDRVFDGLPGAGKTQRHRRSRDLGDLFAAVVEELESSHQLVDRVYELEKDLRAAARSDQSSADLREFAGQRFERAAGFTADLIHTAWRLSAELPLPSWWRPRQQTPAADSESVSANAQSLR